MHSDWLLFFCLFVFFCVRNVLMLKGSAVDRALAGKLANVIAEL